ncbi:MAG TPA: HD domain-containing protein [Nitrososphaerales archaeon]|nr:HD domain-containing protein [Nitrososphaerales archaeon]
MRTASPRLAWVAEIRDPIHGYIDVTEVEREIIDSPFLQRLRRIHQLAGAYLVYPGATHTRFEHVLGAMNFAGQLANSISAGFELDDDDAQEIRLAALLHDVGHGPFSHMFDEVLSTLKGLTHEDASQDIIKRSEINDILEKHGFSARSVSRLAVGKKDGPSFMNEIIAGGLSADLMDYLLRDSYFTGVEYGRVDVHRVINSVCVIDNHLAIDQASIPAFEAMLLARYQMFTNVYFHRTVRAAQLMLVHAMQLADGELHLTDISDPEDYLTLTDEAVLERLTRLSPSSRQNSEARALALDFRGRHLVKCVYEEAVRKKHGPASQLIGDEAVRARTARVLAKAAGVDPMHVYIDVPTTPAFPYTPSKERLTSLPTFRREGGKKVVPELVPMENLQLLRSISGFVNIVRIYTKAEHRGVVEGVAERLLGQTKHERKRTALK